MALHVGCKREKNYSHLFLSNVVSDMILHGLIFDNDGPIIVIHFGKTHFFKMITFSTFGYKISNFPKN